MSKKARWRYVIGYLIGLALFGAIIYLGGIGSIQATLSPRLDFLLLCFAANLLLFVTSSLRWGYVINKIEGYKVCSYYNYFVFFMSGRFLGQYISRAGGDLLLRPALLNRVNGVALKKGIYATFLEKTFDLMLILILIIPAVLYLFKITPGYISLLIAITSFAALLVFSVQRSSKFLGTFKRALLWGGFALKKTPLLNRLARDKYLEKINNLDKFKLLEKKTLHYLLAMTFVRLIFVIGRLYFLVAALGLSIPLSTLLVGIPVAQLSLILALTPGALGVLEGGWYAVFAIAGIAPAERSAFLIGQRVYWFIFINLIFLMSYLIFGAKRLLLFRDVVAISAKGTDE